VFKPRIETTHVETFKEFICTAVQLRPSPQIFFHKPVERLVLRGKIFARSTN